MVHILFVDDEPDLESMIRQKFRKQVRDGLVELHFSSDGQQALDFLEKEKGVQLMFTDINMPVMTGLELLSNLKKKYSSVISVVISAYDDLEKRKIAFDNGAFEFLTKPINFPQLEQTLQKTLDMISKRPSC